LAALPLEKIAVIRVLSKSKIEVLFNQELQLSFLLGSNPFLTAAHLH
jgi:hypothetical protein